ncbi:MAG: MurR/RpiR family transcriptional regulator [Aminobacterium sp.]|jgi:DNA-binding MurR/RpiR family transcriptional regulator|uniref:MurR/RpiR family transcriptional regulator n=1 Tax=unclassified Aminobacterium TaxID=2685012 RepID=UPI001BCF5E57|nr:MULTISPECIES: MurR/RpiR family transcriptional regulator [unclassified Aminobacterium]MDD2206757.1 MurR/RpiR family transcriptional regulator [Aminobacterium sp.]MDD3426914.1 MurR/RpiR family transcriptional regulator [Aminobacterium sp.]MDD3707801.1 MurR/RpiR family transcriptional regulator [Aminobacterium sp.]MDD4229133.1 MurR/RpiR family transcriptional regulator [Aminobacterium sp.]MDD4552061.1 MurR/RpiR family transcriptional regulator [Aminobacterium sp.]
MSDQDFLDLLRQKMDGMPNKARRVVEYILANSREAAFLSIGEVADKLDVSKAQLVRVARMLGYDGYASLKDALKKTVLQQVNPSAMLSKIMKDHKDIPDEIYRLEHANIDDTWNQIQADQVSTFCSMLQEGKTIFCVGWGISALVAESLYTRLLELSLKGVLLKRGSLALIEQARAIEKGDIVIVCELPSYVIEVTDSIKLAAERGARIITITDSPAAPVCKFAKLSFFVSDMSPTFGSSIIGPIFLIHILTSVLAANMGDQAKKALERQAKGLHDERIYYPTYELRY